MNTSFANIQPAPKAAVEFHVRLVREDEWGTWNEFVKASPQGTMFHTTRWLSTSGLPFHIYGCFKDDVLVGGMVVEVLDRRTAGHSHHCPYLGVVLPPPFPKYLTTLTYHKNITIALANHVKGRFQMINCRMGPEMPDVQPFIWARYSTSVRYTYRIDTRDLDQAWRNMEDKRRNDIRKAERDGITVDPAGTMDEVLSLAEITFERQGEEAGFKDLAARREKALRPENQCRCFVARNKAGSPVAGVFLVWDDKAAYYLVGGYDTDRAHRGAGALAIWEAVRYTGTNLGLQRFDFTGSTIRPIERFFRDFGGILTPTYVVDFQHPSLSRDMHRIWERIKRLWKRS
jgi:hypothetical protein